MNGIDTDRMRVAMDRRGFSARELSRQSGVNYTTVLRLVGGRSRGVRWAVLYRIMHALHMSINEILISAAPSRQGESVAKADEGGGNGEPSPNTHTEASNVGLGS